MRRIGVKCPPVVDDPRNELEQFCGTWVKTWREDSSNADRNTPATGSATSSLPLLEREFNPQQPPDFATRRDCRGRGLLGHEISGWMGHGSPLDRAFMGTVRWRTPRSDVRSSPADRVASRSSD